MKAATFSNYLIPADTSNSGSCLILGRCAPWARNCVLVLTPLNWLLPSPLGDAVDVLGCQVPLDYFFVLSFRQRLIMKLLLHGVLINRLPVLDAVDLGGCSFSASLGESY